MEDMDKTTEYLCQNIQGAKFGYVQSDEISILITDYDDIDTHAWFKLKGSSSSDGAGGGVVSFFLDGPATTSISESEFVRLVLAEDGPECC